MALQELVRAFNRLPRSRKIQSSLIDNHWYFVIEHVSLPPPADLVHLVNPGRQFHHIEGPTQILSYESVAARADVVLPLLLKAFISAMDSTDPRIKPLAPWT